MSNFPRCHCGRAAQHENPPLCDEHLGERVVPPEFADENEPPRVIVFDTADMFMDCESPEERRELEMIDCRDFVDDHLDKYRGMRLTSQGEGDAARWCVSAFKYGGAWGSKDDGN